MERQRHPLAVQIVFFVEADDELRATLRAGCALADLVAALPPSARVIKVRAPAALQLADIPLILPGQAKLRDVLVIAE